MTYKLTVDCFEPNPNYAEELKKWNDEHRYDGRMFDGAPQPQTSLRTLSIELTEAEWKAVKKAVVEAMA